LGVSRQKFFYVPGAHTDGVFAIIGEETGFIGAMLVIGLFAYLVYRGFKVALNARDDFGCYLAMGVVCWIAFQAIINIGGITRSIPLTGIPLPFVSTVARPDHDHGRRRHPHCVSRYGAIAASAPGAPSVPSGSGPESRLLRAGPAGTSTRRSPSRPPCAALRR
jgi:hypothetical protein